VIGYQPPIIKTVKNAPEDFYSHPRIRTLDHYYSIVHLTKMFFKSSQHFLKLI